MLRTFLMTVLIGAAALIPLAAHAQDQRVLTGELAYQARIALPESSVMVIEVRDAMDAVVAESRMPTEGRQVPLQFEIAVPAGKVLRLRAGLAQDAGIDWISEGLRIGPEDSAELGTLMLQRFQPMSFASGYRCGDRLIRVGFAGARMIMDTGTARLAMVPVPAASGAKYQADGDSTTTFWDRAGSAMVTIAGRELPECRISFPLADDRIIARGTEPFWRAVVEARTVTLDRLEMDPLALPLTDSRLSDTGDIVIAAGGSAQAPELVLTRAPIVCRDAMTGMPFPESVDLAIGDTVLSGCGGDPADLLVGRLWQIVELQGMARVADRAAEIVFHRDGLLFGTSGCNRFFGSYALIVEGLSLGPLGSTRVACPGALMAQEQSMFEALRHVDRFDLDASGDLLLIGADTVLIRARASRRS